MTATAWPEPTLLDTEHYMGATPPTQWLRVKPIWTFPITHREAIERSVLADHPPAKMLDLGHALIVSRAWYEWHWHRGLDPDKNRPTIPAHVRRAVLERDGHVCGICHIDVDPSDIHLDHIIPWSRGGQHTVANLRVTHSRCNMRRGNREDHQP